MSLNIISEGANTYAIKYNSEISKNEIWLIKSDGTYDKLIDFTFPSGFWTPATSYASDKDGKLYIKDSGSGIPEEEKGWVLYDPSTNTISTGVKDGYNEGFQKVFSDVLKIDSLIKNETDSSGDKSSVIGTDELVASTGTTIIANGTDSKDGTATTVIGSNNIVGSDGDTLISKESDGSVHIGENSLVTVETDGVQQLYATNASDEMININIKKGTDLLIDGVSVSGSLNTNATNITANKTAIASNTTGIATNKTAIASNTTGIATNTTSIGAISTDLSTFKTSTNNQMQALEREMNSYSSGIASAIAMSQFSLAQDGFSVGMGRGSFKSENETAFGIGYGGKFTNGSMFQIQASKSGDAGGVGLTITF